MANRFFSSCKSTAQYVEASAKVREYVKETLGIEPFGCCRVSSKKLTPEDTAIVICTNCSNLIDENAEAQIKSLWEIIDGDQNFKFPDYNGEKMTIQDCWFAFDRPNMQKAARSLLEKMNIQVVELDENFERAKFCGGLVKPCVESNKTLAPKRYADQFPHMFNPMSEEDQDEYFRKHCEQIETERVATYCRACANSINRGGKKARHIMELVFLGD